MATATDWPTDLAKALLHALHAPAGRPLGGHGATDGKLFAATQRVPVFPPFDANQVEADVSSVEARRTAWIEAL
jgi:hypothetical protein